MNEKIKDLLTLLLIILASAVILVLLFEPEKLGNPYSMKSIEEHKFSIEAIENELLSNEQNITRKIEEKNRLMEMNAESRKQADAMRQKLDISQMKYHIPSLLITLEQAAKNINIGQGKFHIDYNKITSTEERQKIEEELRLLEEEKAREMDEKKKDPQEEEDLIDAREIIEEPLETEENYVEGFQYAEAIERGATDDLLLYDKPEAIAGLVTTTIPVRLHEVTYAETKEYISFLDNLDYVEPAIIDLYSEGEKITAVILIHVFHQSEGGETNE